MIDASAPQDAAQATLATELKARLMAEYRDELDSYNDTAEARALAEQMDLLERRLRCARCGHSGWNSITCTASIWWAMRWSGRCWVSWT